MGDIFSASASCTVWRGPDGSWSVCRNTPYADGAANGSLSVSSARTITSYCSNSRGIMLFDLSSLSGMYITSVTAYFYHKSSFGGTYVGDACIGGCTWDGTVDRSYYGQYNPLDFFGYANWTADAWNSITFNSSGLAYVQSCVGGNCPLMLRNYSHDFLNIVPSLGSLKSAAAANDGDAYDLYLEIEYTPITTLAPTTTLTTAAPTTVITTPAPTTLATTLAPTTLLTTLAPTTLATTPPPATIVFDGPDAFLSTTFDCNTFRGGDFIGRLSVDLDFNSRKDTLISNTYNYLRCNLDIYGKSIISNYISDDTTVDAPLRFRITGPLAIDVYTTTGYIEQGTIQWSKIGSLDFTIDHSNEAGKGFLKELGTIYGIRKLGNSVVVYGTNGVGQMMPSETSWGFKLISEKGIYSRDSHTGNEMAQWFIDAQGDLNEVSDGVKRIGYKEFLSTLTNPVMMIDEFRQMIYICDENTGYIYSFANGSFGEGHAGMTGFGYEDSTEMSCNPGLSTLTPTTILTTIAPTTSPPQVLSEYITGDVGRIIKSSSVWSIAQGSASGDSTSGSINAGAGDSPSYFVSRAPMLFDLSGIAGTVVGVTWHGYDIYDEGGQIGCVQGSTYDGTLGTDNFNDFTGNFFGSVAFGTGPAWYEIEFNTEGIAFVQSCLGGDCALMFRDYTNDYLNVAPTGSVSNSIILSQGGGLDPFIEIEIFVPTTAPPTIAPTTVPVSTLIKTDTMDFGTRKEKTITKIQLSTDIDIDIYASVEYKLTKDGSFNSTPWTKLTPHGVAYIACYGIEFRFKFKTLEDDTFEIDQLIINGYVHGASGSEYIRGFYG